MKRTTEYVALDVHREATAASAREQNGRVIVRTMLPTEPTPFTEFLRGMRGSVHVAFEEGTQARCLHDLPVPLADRVVKRREGSPVSVEFEAARPRLKTPSLLLLATAWFPPGPVPIRARPCQPVANASNDEARSLPKESLHKSYFVT